MHYECPSFTCILTSYICDGIVDCLDASDEINCSDLISTGNNTASYEVSYLSTISEDLYYECHQGKWIPLTQLCDGQYDCSDGSDELSCSKSKTYVYKLLSYTTTVSIKVWFMHKVFITRSE